MNIQPGAAKPRHKLLFLPGRLAGKALPDIFFPEK
jgi:hypothetical protein